MNRRSALILIVVAAAALPGCEMFGNKDISDEDVKVIVYAELRDMLRDKSKAPLVMVDVRDRSEYNKGHIPGAVNIPIQGMSSDDLRPYLGKAKTIVVYAWGPDKYAELSLSATKVLIERRYKNVYDFNGGLRDWLDVGNPLEGRAAPAVTPASQPQK